MVNVLEVIASSSINNDIICIIYSHNSNVHYQYMNKRKLECNFEYDLMYIDKYKLRIDENIYSKSICDYHKPLYDRITYYEVQLRNEKFNTLLDGKI